jgi:ATP-dependent RNA helicase SUPV3L1/SUV3
MPDRDVAFVALDEAQLGADPERGHVFTDRLLHARPGRDDDPGVRGAQAHDPRAGARSGDRGTAALLDPVLCGRQEDQPPAQRSAIVAFSAEEVYAVAEMLRRLRGARRW